MQTYVDEESNFSVRTFAIEFWSSWLGITEIYRDGELMMRRKSLCRLPEKSDAELHAMTVGKAILRVKPFDESAYRAYFAGLSNLDM